MAVHDASLSDSRVLVIRSDGPNFCMGGNVPEWPGKSADWFRTFIAECNSSFHAIEALRIPTVAVVRGGAIGGGFELALACDFLVAAEDATFFAVEIRSGNIPLAGGLQRLAERVGRARAAKLALLGEPFSGIIAGDLGIVTLVVPEADLDETSRRLVDKLANGPTKACAAARTILKGMVGGRHRRSGRDDARRSDRPLWDRRHDKRHSQFGESYPSRRPAVSADIFGKVAPGLGRLHKR